ncbi:Uncharacterised protein [Bordetella pertussis]|nr:Uncharacterised protein [Bordetella pertussis]CFW20093.1 Uncharacterised protein [Bordetella pertussis]
MQGQGRKQYARYRAYHRHPAGRRPGVGRMAAAQAIRQRRPGSGRPSQYAGRRADAVAQRHARGAGAGAGAVRQGGRARRQGARSAKPVQRAAAGAAEPQRRRQRRNAGQRHRAPDHHRQPATAPGRQCQQCHRGPGNGPGSPGARRPAALCQPAAKHQRRPGPPARGRRGRHRGSIGPHRSPGGPGGPGAVAGA